MAHKRTELICSGDLASPGEQTGPTASFASCQQACLPSRGRVRFLLFSVVLASDNLTNLDLKILRSLNLCLSMWHSLFLIIVQIKEVSLHY